MSSKANRTTRLTLSVLIVALLLTAAGAKTIYVDDDAAGANNGSSWGNAYNYLQDALTDASLFEKPVEIRVAQGVYRPNGGLVAIPEFDWRTTTFQLINSVALKGGYAGLGAADPNARDVELYETILSGDLASNDSLARDLKELMFELNAENSFTVVTGSQIDDTAVLDGFTITGGCAQEPHFGDSARTDGRNAGGGMYNVSGHPTLIGCTFAGNSAAFGGGMYNSYASPTLTECTFKTNFAWIEGAGMANYNASPTLANCTFVKNSSLLGVQFSLSADAGTSDGASNPTIINYIFDRIGPHLSGGGMYNDRSSPILRGCAFSENGARSGGGMANNDGSNPILTNCTFNGNSSSNGSGLLNIGSHPKLLSCTFIRNYSSSIGAGMNNYQSSPTLTNCAFIGNWAYDGGGGMYNDGGSEPLLTRCLFLENACDNRGGGLANSRQSHPRLINCIISGNSASRGAGMAGFDSSAMITNSIIWDNGIWQIAGGAVVSYSNVQGGWPGEGNIDSDPLFAKPGYWVNRDDPNQVVGKYHPNAVWAAGDYHLKSQAGRWDPASESWVVDDVTSPCIDAGDPNSPVEDEPEPNGGRINMGAYGGTAEASKSLVPQTIVYIQWLGHSSVKIWAEDCIVYVDPQNLSISPHDATLVCVTHTHGDHYSPSDIARVSNAQTQFIAPPDVIQQYGKGQAIAPGQVIESYCARLTGVAAYNINKTNHPKSRNWVGYVIELGGKRIYVAGDTDLIDEMKSLGHIDVAILPAGGTYTMNAVEAAEATQYIKPDLAIPYHWGRIVGTLADAETFAQLAKCAVKILAAGETISSDSWPVYSPLVARWKLDEAAGDLADDSEGGFDGLLYGNPAWQPTGGKIRGALQLDGVDDYVDTPFVLNPNGGPFSVYAWVKGGAAGQVIVSQTDGTRAGATWLGADPAQGRLVTGLVPPAAGRFLPQPLVSGFVLTYGQWHHVGLVWDGAQRHLYADDTEVAKDAGTLAPLQSCDGGLHLGAGKSLDTDTLWAGLLDDVGIYDQALSPAELGPIAP